MFHDGISPEGAKGIKILRERIGEIPSSKLDETLNIATWNIRDFGKRERNDDAIHYIAEVLSNFDLIAITELGENLTCIYKVMNLLGVYWKIIFSDTVMGGKKGNSERIGYLYDKRAVTFTGLAAEVDPIRKKNEKYMGKDTWFRSPYIASFRAGRFDFILITAHIRWKKPKERIGPIKALAEWVDKRMKSEHVFDKDIIVMGDFNIPKKGDEIYKALISKGLEIPDALRGVHGTNLSRENDYDQIVHYKKYTKTFKDVGGVVDFYKKDWRKLFPESKYPEMTKKDFTFQMSDHLPLWVQLDTWIDDEELDQEINK